MARSKCPACDSNRFELSTESPAKSRVKINLVQCVSCGTVVGTMDYYPVGTDVQKMAGEVDELKSEIASVQSALVTINNNIGKIARALSQR